MVGTPAERHSVACASEHAGDRPALVAAILQELLSADRRTDATVVLPTSLDFSGARTGGHAEIFAGLSAALLRSRWLEALAACQRILRNARESVSDSLHANIVGLRKSLEQQLLVKSAVDLVTDSRRVHLLPRRSILIGRPGGELPADIAIDCRWLSRGERNLSLFSDGINWFLEDLGSTNGNFMNGVRLMPGAPLAIPVGRTLIQIGRPDESAAPVMLELRRPVKDPGAVVISLRHTGSALATASAWPTVQHDLARCWIVFRSQIGIAAEEDCAVRIDGVASGIAGAVRYQNGFWAVPALGSKVSINDTEFEAPTPLAAGTLLGIRTMRFRVEASDDADAPGSTDFGDDP